MAKKLGKLASRYARALYKTLLEDGTTRPEDAAEMIEGFAAIWQKEVGLQNIVLSPMFDIQKRSEVLAEVSSAAGFPAMLQRFLQVLLERDRLAYFQEIAAAFRAVTDEAAGVVKVRVTTARQVAEDERGAIEKSISRQLQSGGQNAGAVFNWSEDPALIGGMVVRYGGIVLDGSLRGRLEKLERGLTD